jgi:hypothetical protein
MPAQVDWLNDRQWRLALTEALEGWNSGLRGNMEELAALAEREAWTRCPVRTGRLRSGIESTVEDTPEWCVLNLFDEVPYSAFVEFGTRFVSARPFLRPGLAAAQAAYETKMPQGLK